MRWLVLFFAIACLHGEMNQVRLFSGSSNPALAEAVADQLKIPLGHISLGRFNDGEIRIKILDSVRNCDVFLIQSTCLNDKSSVNDSVMELYLMIRTMKRASARSVTAVIPYFGYARQDRKREGRVPISASDVAMLLELAGADHVISIDLHCEQLQGFFHQTPIDNLFASTIFVPYIAQLRLWNPVIVSPDAGGVERAKLFIEGLNSLGHPSNLAIIVKQRAEAGVIDKMNLVGDVADRDAVIVDDICDTAGTLVEAAKLLKKNGANRVYACVTHPLLSGPACKRILESPFELLLVSDTIPLRCATLPPNILQLTIAPLIASAIERKIRGNSIMEIGYLRMNSG